MNKKLFKKIPFIKPKKAWLDLTKQVIDIDYFIEANIRIIDHHKTLVLDFYTAQNLCQLERPSYRIFLTKTDDITMTFQDGKVKWLTGSISHVFNLWWKEQYKRFIFVNPKSANTVCRFLQYKNHLTDSPSIIKALNSLQSSIRALRLKKRHKIECQEIDKQMRAIRPLPKSFYKWVEEEALFNSRYIYYNKKHKHIDGYCTHCHQDVQITDPKHNKQGICPSCGSPITFKSIGYAKNLTDYARVTYFQKTANGFIVRYFHVTKIYGQNYRNPSLYLQERFRDFYFTDTATYAYFCYDHFKQHGPIRWCPDNGYTMLNTFVYPTSLKTAIQGTPWQYCCLSEYIEHTEKVVQSVSHYLEFYPKMPQLEYLIKAKLYKLAHSLVYEVDNSDFCKSREKTLPTFLQVDKYYLKKMIATNASYEEYEFYRGLSKHHLLLTDKELDFFLSHFKPKDYDILLKILTLTKRATKTINYLVKNTSKLEKSIDDIASIWQDYLFMCQYMNYNLERFILLYPRNLQEEHDKLSKMYIHKLNEAADRALLDMYDDTMKQYGFETDQYMIDAPKCHADLVNESAALKHCVHIYTPRIIAKKTTVLFLRQQSAPDTPFYTIEITKNYLRQCKAYDNHTPQEKGDQSVLDFLALYKRKVLSHVDSKAAA